MGKKTRRADAVATAEVLLREADAREQKYKAWTVLASGVAVTLVVLAMFPIAYVLRGSQTVISVNLALSFSFVTSGLACLAGLVASKHEKRADRLEARNKRLSRDVKELQRRLRDHDVDDDLIT